MIKSYVIDERMTQPYCNGCAYASRTKWVGNLLHLRKREIPCREIDCPCYPQYRLYRGIGRVTNAVKKLGRRAKAGLKNIRK